MFLRAPRNVLGVRGGIRSGGGRVVFSKLGRFCSKRAENCNWEKMKKKRAQLTKAMPVSPASRALAWSIFLFLVGLFITVISWPVMDVFLIPHSISRRLVKSFPQHVSDDDKIIRAAKALQEYIDGHKTASSKRVLILLADDPVFAAKVLRHMQETMKDNGTPSYHASFGAMTCPATMFYGMLYECYTTTSLIIAYIKFLNAAAMTMTMNQEHVHTTYILFEQFLGQLRVAVQAQENGAVIAISGVENILREMRNPANEAARPLTSFVRSLHEVLTEMTTEKGIFIVSGGGQDLLSVQNCGLAKGDPSLFSDTLLGRSLSAFDDGQGAQVVYLESDSQVTKATLRCRYDALSHSEKANKKVLDHLVTMLKADTQLHIGGILAQCVKAGFGAEEVRYNLDELVRLKILKRVAGVVVDSEELSFHAAEVQDVQYKVNPTFVR